MFTNFSAAQINRLAQRLSEVPLGRSASAAKAGERFQRLLAAKIGAERAAGAAQAILGAPGFETAMGRLVAEIEGEEFPVAEDPAAAADPAPVAEADPEATAPPSARRRRRDADLDARARQGELPAAPDFSAPTHARFRAKLAALVELAGKADATGYSLRAVMINPVSSTPKALARYRDLAVKAIEARKSRLWRSSAVSSPATVTATISTYAPAPGDGRRLTPRRTRHGSAHGDLPLRFSSTRS